MARGHKKRASAQRRGGHKRRAARGGLASAGAAVRLALREARAAIVAGSCARAVDALGLASFHAGRALAHAGKRNVEARGIVPLLKRARERVAFQCGRPAPKGSRS